MCSNNAELKKVAVLMSTYNGEKYLVEQVKSILHQENVEVSIFVRDDGSSDCTVNILESFGKDTIVLFKDDVNIGPERSFKKLLWYVYENEPVYDFYAFADQDDVWLPDKLIKAIKAIGESDFPVLYFSNQYIYRDGYNEGLRFDHLPDYSLLQCICDNKISGCTMVFNWKLVQEICIRLYKDDYFISNKMHDTWMMITANIVGECIYDKTAHMLYRQHESNVVGMKRENLADKIKLQKKRKNTKKNIAISILKCFNNVINDADREPLELLAYYNCSVPNKFKLIHEAKKFNYFGYKKSILFVKAIIGWL